MPKSKGPIEVPTRDAAIYGTTVSLRIRRRNLTEQMLGIIDHVDYLAQFLREDEAVAVLREVGMSEDEIATFMLFTPNTGSYKEQLSNLSLSYDAIRALGKVSDDRIRHSITILEANGRLGECELGSLRAVPDAVKTSDNDAIMDIRDQHLREECQRIADTRMERFDERAKKLFWLMHGYETWRYKLINYEQNLRDSGFLSSLGDEELDELYDAWPELEAEGQAFLVETEKEIVELATIVLSDFDEIFPLMYVAMEDWPDLKIDNPVRQKFAEARYALDKLTKGGFVSGFPSFSSESYSWDALGTIQFLAGVRRGRKVSQRFAPRPVRKLKAVTIGTASGAEAVGLYSAGFRVRASYPANTLGEETIQANRRAYPSPLLQLGDPALAADVRQRITEGNGDTLSLIAGALDGRAFTERGRGEADARQQFTYALRLVADAEPQAFFFECSPEFLAPTHTPFRNRLIWAARDLGYEVGDIITMNGRDYGLPQERIRSAFFGVKGTLASPLRSPVPANPYLQAVGDAVSPSVLFSHFSEVSGKPLEERSPAENRYLTWIDTWMKESGSKWTPDTHTLAHFRRSREIIERWRWQNAFLFGSEDQPTPRSDLRSWRSLPLTIPVLKRIQGIPDEWVFVGSFEEQVEQICSTIPPVIMRAVGHIIHEAITGEVIDLDAAVRKEVNGKRWRPTTKFCPISDSNDPARALARTCRTEIEDEMNWVPYHHPSPRPIKHIRLEKSLLISGQGRMDNTDPY